VEFGTTQIYILFGLLVLLLVFMVLRMNR